MKVSQCAGRTAARSISTLGESSAPAHGKAQQPSRLLPHWYERAMQPSTSGASVVLRHLRCSPRTPPESGAGARLVITEVMRNCWPNDYVSSAAGAVKFTASLPENTRPMHPTNPRISSEQGLLLRFHAGHIPARALPSETGLALPQGRSREAQMAECSAVR
jgi:hypothetical protein